MTSVKLCAKDLRIGMVFRRFEEAGWRVVLSADFHPKIASYVDVKYIASNGAINRWLYGSHSVLEVAE